MILTITTERAKKISSELISNINIINECITKGYTEQENEFKFAFMHQVQLLITIGLMADYETECITADKLYHVSHMKAMEFIMNVLDKI